MFLQSSSTSPLHRDSVRAVLDILRKKGPSQTSRLRNSSAYAAARWGVKQLRRMREQRCLRQIERTRALLKASCIVRHLPEFRGTFELDLCNRLSRRILLGGFEPSRVRMFEIGLKPGFHVVDIGANIGLFTVLAVATGRRGGCMLAAEPVPSMVKLLRSNVPRVTGAWASRDLRWRRYGAVRQVLNRVRRGWRGILLPRVHRAPRCTASAKAEGRRAWRNARCAGRESWAEARIHQSGYRGGGRPRFQRSAAGAPERQAHHLQRVGRPASYVVEMERSGLLWTCLANAGTAYSTKGRASSLWRRPCLIRLLARSSPCPPRDVISSPKDYLFGRVAIP